MAKSPSRKPSYLNFDKAAYAWKADVGYRKHPERYKIGKGEQGVLIGEPYKSEITPHWRSKIRRSRARARQTSTNYSKRT